MVTQSFIVGHSRARGQEMQGIRPLPRFSTIKHLPKFDTHLAQSFFLMLIFSRRCFGSRGSQPLTDGATRKSVGMSFGKLYSPGVAEARGGVLELPGERAGGTKGGNGMEKAAKPLPGDQNTNPARFRLRRHLRFGRFDWRRPGDSRGALPPSSSQNAQTAILGRSRRPEPISARRPRRR